MNLYSLSESYHLYHGSMLDMSQVIEPNSIDAIITDPPYELNFMDKGWDRSGIAFQKETWEECYKVLKPGGYLLAFGGSRTFHRIACAIEDADFEIRDVIMWLYGSGFPKSLNIGLVIDKKNGVDNKTGNIKTNGSGTGSVVTTREGSLKKEYEERIALIEWSGWGTALKPSYEPIIVARKPPEGSVTDNVLKYGVGGINIDECRIKTNDELRRTTGGWNNAYIGGENVKPINTLELYPNGISGRFPANTILTYDDTDYEEVCGGMPYTSGSSSIRPSGQSRIVYSGAWNNIVTQNESWNDSGSASRYFYCAKASTKDRDEGLEEFDKIQITDGSLRSNAETARKYGANPSAKSNIHPTVKPTELMQYLIRLVCPKGATILDPFNGSGSTGKAVMYENGERGANYHYIGIELTEEYLPISQARIEYAERKSMQTTLF